MRGPEFSGSYLWSSIFGPGVGADADDVTTDVGRQSPSAPVHPKRVAQSAAGFLTWLGAHNQLMGKEIRIYPMIMGRVRCLISSVDSRLSSGVYAYLSERSMSLWGFDGGENTLSTWSSLSQFDEMVWNEFGENGDHVVSDPNGNQISWMENGESRKKVVRDVSANGVSNRDSSTPRVGSDRCIETSGLDQPVEEKDISKRGGAPRPEMLPGGTWSDLGSVVDLPLESQPFDSGSLPVPQQTTDMPGNADVKDRSVSMLSDDVQLYIGEEDGSMVTDPFSLTEIGSQAGEMELFGDGNNTSKTESLLDLGWANIGNLDDMDKLFRNNDTSFEPVMGGNTDSLEWPSSPTSVSNSGQELQMEKENLEESKTAVVKVEAATSEKKIEVISCAVSSGEAQASVGFRESCDVASPKSSGPQKSASAQQLSARGPEKNEHTRESKAQRPRRHAANKKRTEDRLKRGTSYRKLSPGPPYALPHGEVMPLRMPGPPLHPQRGPPPLQMYPPVPGMMSLPPHQFQMPQNVPYIQVGYPVHHMPMVPSKLMPHMQYPQPMFVDMQSASNHQQRPPNQHVSPMPSPLAPKVPFQVPGSMEQQQQQLQAHPSFDPSCRPPAASPSMTPQEKLEKLRWRQQMQARIAVEQQQQQLLASQSSGGGGMEPLVFLRQQQASSQSLVPGQQGRMSGEPGNDIIQRRLVPAVGAQTASEESEEDSSLEGSVLRQLEMTISQLDIGTRLVIRNALYRLARSARKRRAAGVENGCSSQSSGERNSGNNAMESSTASDSPSCRGSRATSMSEMETETNPIDRTIAKLLFYKPQPQYLPGPMYIADNPPYSGLPQMTAGVPNAPWGWSSAAVPPNNGVGPPGPPAMSASLAWGGKPDENPVPNSGWAPLPVMNGYTPVFPGYHMDTRFGAAVPVSTVRNMSFANAPQPEIKEEPSRSPVLAVQNETCPSTVHVVGNSTQVNNMSNPGTVGHTLVKPQEMEFKEEGGPTAMDTVGDHPLSSNPFLPDSLQSGDISSSGLEEMSCVRQFNSTTDSEQAFGQGNETPCITEDPAQFLTSAQDEVRDVDEKQELETLKSFNKKKVHLVRTFQNGRTPFRTGMAFISVHKSLTRWKKVQPRCFLRVKKIRSTVLEVTSPECTRRQASISCLWRFDWEAHNSAKILNYEASETRSYLEGVAGGSKKLVPAFFELSALRSITSSSCLRL
ncbi:hypothetical protein R1flu_017800 [Riccia fluitans]|uniref:Uncharacterized protein n=1 Tax=Riccia fluitans TaxID=41844 RepID=A0ABD1ZF23_9MARC